MEMSSFGGCGLTHQLGNRPRDVQNPHDIEEDPEDELRPYRVSSKQLEKRFVMLADGGAQHTVELAWDTSYSKLQADDTGSSSLQPADLSSLPADVPQRESDEKRGIGGTPGQAQIDGSCSRH